MLIKTASGIMLALLLIGTLTLIFNAPLVGAVAEVRILSHSGWVDPSGYYHISGEVENTGDVYVKLVKITATFYDSVGAVVATPSTYTIIDVIRPGMKAPFEVLLDDTAQVARVVNYSLSVTFSETTPVPNGLEILEARGSMEGLNYYVVGRIKCNGTQTATYVKVVATFYNLTGHVIATAFTFSDPSNITPNQTAIFYIILSYPNKVNELPVGSVPENEIYTLAAQSNEYVLPEFPSTVIPPLFMILTLLAVVFAKRRTFRRPNPKFDNNVSSEPD